MTGREAPVPNATIWRVNAASADVVRSRFGGAGVVLLLIGAGHGVIHAYSALLPWVYPLALVDLRFSVTALGLMVGVTNLAGGFLQLAAGPLTRIVRRSTLVGSGVALLGLAGIATALSATFAQFFAANLASRIVTSAQHPLGNSLLADLYTPARRGTAIASHVAGGNLGTVLITPGAALLASAWGWRPALLLLTLPAALAGLAILFSVRERFTPTATASAVHDLAAGVRAVLRSRNLVLVFVASLIAAGGRGQGVILLVVPLYLKRQLHIHEPEASLLYTLLLVGSVVGPVATGWISDRVGTRAVLVVAYLLSAVAILSFAGAPAGGLWLFVALTAMGLIVYAESPLLQVALANEAPRAERDAIFSLYFAVAFGIGALWTTAVGVLLDRVGYAPVFGAMIASYLVTAGCVGAMQERAVRRRGRPDDMQPEVQLGC